MRKKLVIITCSWIVFLMVVFSNCFAGSPLPLKKHIIQGKPVTQQKPKYFNSKHILRNNVEALPDLEVVSARVYWVDKDRNIAEFEGKIRNRGQADAENIVVKVLEYWRGNTNVPKHHGLVITKLSKNTTRSFKIRSQLLYYGTYDFVLKVNPNFRLKELRYDNNMSRATISKRRLPDLYVSNIGISIRGIVFRIDEFEHWQNHNPHTHRFDCSIHVRVVNGGHKIATESTLTVAIHSWDGQKDKVDIRQFSVPALSPNRFWDFTIDYKFYVRDFPYRYVNVRVQAEADSNYQISEEKEKNNIKVLETDIRCERGSTLCP